MMPLRIATFVAMLLAPLSARASNAVSVLPPTTPVCGTTGGLGDVRSAAVSPDGAHLYAASTQGTVAVFARDAASGRLSQVEVVDVGPTFLPQRLAISADGQNLYLPTGGSVTVFDRDASTGHLVVLEVQSPGFFEAAAVTVSPDDNQVYAAANGSLAVFTRTPATGALTIAQMLREGVGGVDGLGRARDAVVASDGAHVYVASWNDDAIAIFARDAGTGLLTFVGTRGLGQAWQLAPSPDGAYLYATGATGYLTTFARNAMTGLLTLVDFRYGGAALAISGDGTSLYHYLDPFRLAVEARDPGTGALTPAQNVTAYGSPQTSTIALSPNDGHVYAFSSGDLGVYARDGGTGMLTFVEAQRGAAYDNRGVAITPDGAHLYVGCANRSSVVELVRDAGSGAVSVAGVQHDGVAGVDGLQGARAVAVSPDGAHVYVASADEPLYQQSALVAFARDAGSGVLSFIEAERNGVGGVTDMVGARSLVVTPDGAHVYVGASYGVTVFTRNAATGALGFAGPVPVAPDGEYNYAVSSVAVSPDGAYLYALTAYHLDVFARDAGTGALTLVETEKGFEGGVSIAISPDGQTLYVGAQNDRAVWAFDRNPATGRLVLLHTRLVTRSSYLANGAVTSVTVSPDGAYVYAASGGFSSASSLAIFRRDTVTGRLFLAEERFGPSLGGVRTVVASPDRRHVYAAATAYQGSVDALSVFAPRAACAPLPVTTCRTPTVAGRAFVRLTDHPVNDDLNVLKWKWIRGSATTLADFGMPQASTDFVLCLYDASGLPQPRLDALAPAGGTCPSKACWKPSAKKVQYRDPVETPDGLQRITLKPGADGRAAIIVKAADGTIPVPTLPLTPPVRVQMQASNGECWEATYSTPLENDASGFQARAD